jgi:hypothetical protein
MQVRALKQTAVDTFCPQLWNQQLLLPLIFPLVKQAGLSGHCHLYSTVWTFQPFYSFLSHLIGTACQRKPLQALTSLNQKAQYGQILARRVTGRPRDPFSHSCLRNSVLGFNTDTLEVQRDYAYAHGFPLFAEVLDALVLRPSAINYSKSLWERKIWWQRSRGLYPEWLFRVAEESLIKVLHDRGGFNGSAPYFNCTLGLSLSWWKSLKSQFHHQKSVGYLSPNFGWHKHLPSCETLGSKKNMTDALIH